MQTRTAMYTAVNPADTLDSEAVDAGRSSARRIASGIVLTLGGIIIITGMLAHRTKSALLAKRARAHAVQNTTASGEIEMQQLKSS